MFNANFGGFHFWADPQNEMFLGSAISNIVLIGSVAKNLSYLTVFEILILIPNSLKLIATNIMETTDKILKHLRNCNC